MQLERNEVRGFFNFDQPFVLDLREMPPGIIAIIGPNGAGKTSLGLESPLAGLYGPGTKPAFPSRDQALADYATSRQAYIESIWTLAGRGQYRVRVNVDGQSRKTDAVIEEILADGRRKPINDGKTSTYKDVVSEIFPSRRSLLASAFSAQNRRGSFGELGQRERMELFVELADLAHYEQRAQTAKRCQQVAESLLARLATALDVLRREATPEALKGTAEMLAQVEVELNDEARRIKAAEGRIAAAEGERPSAVERYERHLTAAAKELGLQQQAANIRAEIEQGKRDAKRIDDDNRHELQQVATRHRAACEALARRQKAAEELFAKTKKDREQRIADNRKLIGAAQSIRDGLARFEAASKAVAELRMMEAAAREALSSAESDLRTAESLLQKVSQAEVALVDAQERAGLLTEVKFGDQCAVDPVCPLVLDAAAAKRRIVGLEAEIGKGSDLRERYHAAAENVAGITAKLVGYRQQIGAEERIIAGTREAVQQAPFLEAAESRIREYEEDLKSAVEQQAQTLAGLREELAAADAQRDKEIGRAKATRADKERELARRAERLEEQLRAAEGALGAARKAMEVSADAKGNLDALDAALAEARQQKAAAESVRARREEQRAELRRRHSELAARIGQVEDVERRHRQVETEALAWEQLTRACGRDGLQRLEIDAAGPTVADIANQLLMVGYGTRFSVDIVTQVATADKKDTKERFTILVYDNDHGGEARDIGDLSGGEGVVVNEAVRAALSCYVNMRSRQPARTIWRDETTGALDPENAPKYVAMLRRLRELSGAVHILFVTHNTDVMEMADAQVRVRSGQASLVLPPYGGSAVA